MIYLFIGQPGSGKTTMAELLVRRLGPGTVWIDGDDLREIFPNTDYSYSGRIRNIEKAFTIARFMSIKGHNVVISMVCPYRAIREDLKASNEVTEVLFQRDDHAGRGNFHVQNFEEPLEKFLTFKNGSDLRRSFGELSLLLGV